MLTKKQQWRRALSHQDLSRERKMATQRQFEEVFHFFFLFDHISTFSNEPYLSRTVFESDKI
jgi:hypothetical protein